MAKELISRHKIDSPTPSDTDEIEIKIHPSFHRWSLQIVPIAAGAVSTINMFVRYKIDGEFYQRNPGGTAVIVENQVNMITSEDPVQEVQLAFTHGVNAPDSYTIELWGAR